MGLDLNKLNKDELLDSFWKFNDLEGYIKFFDIEWNSIGIDVYAYQFKDFSKNNTNGYEWLIYKIDKIETSKEVISQFLGVNFPFRKKINNSSEFEPYRILINEIKWDKSYISKINNSKFMRHFFTTEERNELMQRWQRNKMV